ncbi:hypothetical protein Tsubulata_001460 [Turnera subulata]|uniref:Uncharacterized protein n=1 Tax=Turnera subulata TaxID=218843 RepID=A0A9Q0FDS7_9ROSI|nr:hypothetical protein Tsubulata_001460 [Turnera subulata]
MMKLSRSLKSRKVPVLLVLGSGFFSAFALDLHFLSYGVCSSEKCFFCKLDILLSGNSNEVRDALGRHSLTFQAGISTGSQNFPTKDRFFAPYAIYKGKASLSVQPVLPTFAKLDSGYLKVARRGSMMLTFVPAIGERKYDYGKKQERLFSFVLITILQNFALSATEIGSLISMGPNDSSEFFHDPGKLSSTDGQVRKSLSIKPLANSSGYFIGLTVVNNILKTNERFSVPVTTAEFAVLKAACSFALPHIMGWNKLTNPPAAGSAVGSLPKVNTRVPDVEWDK